MMKTVERLLAVLEDHGGLLDNEAILEAGFDPNLGQAEYDRLVVTIYRINRQKLLPERKLVRVGAGSQKGVTFPIYRVENQV